MTRRPVAVALVVAGLAFVVASAGIVPAARAQAISDCAAVRDLDDMSVQVGSPTPGQTRDEPVVPIEVQVTNTRARPSFPPGSPEPLVARIRVTLLRCRAGQVLPEEFSRTTTAVPSRSMAFSWMTDEVPTNGPFAIEIVAEGTQQQGQDEIQRSRVVAPFALAVAPRTPTGVKAVPSETGATVSWTNAGREPDLLFYEVQRAARGSSTYTTVNDGIVKADKNTVADRPGPGSWRYRVLAIRAGATDDEGIRSPASTEAPVEVAAPAPPTTQAGPGSGSGTSGSSGGAAGSSDTSPSGGTSDAGSGDGTVDLSRFSATLDARRQGTTVTTRFVPPDPGFRRTLPFTTRPTVTAPPPVVEPELPEELGLPEAAAEPTTTLVRDEGQRRRALSFVAFGFLLFVLSMTGLFLKSEVRRFDRLEALGLLDPIEPEPSEPATDGPAAPVVAVAAPSPAVAAPVEPAPSRRERRPRRTRASTTAVVVPPVEEAAPQPLQPEPDHGHAGFDDLVEPTAGVAALPPRRVRRTVAPAHAPTLDVADPGR